MSISVLDSLLDESKDKEKKKDKNPSPTVIIPIGDILIITK